MALLDQLLVEDTLALAWARVRRNGGGAGVDGIGLDEFGRNALLRLGRLRDEVRDGCYRPAPLLRLELPRAGREPRLLAVPAVGDRVLQTAATLVLGPILDRHFEDESFAYRPGRSVRDAVARVAALRDTGLPCVVDVEISAFFDRIPHRHLVARLAAPTPRPTATGAAARPSRRVRRCHRCWRTSISTASTRRSPPRPTGTWCATPTISSSPAATSPPPNVHSRRQRSGWRTPASRSISTRRASSFSAMA